MNIAEPALGDSTAFGKLYLGGPLASFEENAGQTSTSLLRCEGIERLTAAVQITA